MNKIVKDIIKLEGNKLNFKYKGLECQVLRMPHFGHLCGYVTTKKPLTDVQAMSLEVHGGVTYQEGNKVGFDCAHYMDMLPFSDNLYNDAYYRTMRYVKREVKRMVDQIKRTCK